jgi:co-chaperonin GroES (HSP10)
MIKIKVLGKNILAKPIWLNEENKDGIILSSDTDKTRKNYGVVEYIGDEVTKTRVGETIIFQTKEVSQLELEDERFFLIIEDEIIAIEDNG